jgi:hypothetical protein
VPLILLGGMTALFRRGEQMVKQVMKSHVIHTFLLWLQ